MKLSYDSIAVKLGGKQILRSVSLATRPGEIVGIVGANGCGKSTLIKTTFGAVQKQQGTISLDGKPVTAYSPRELASILGYVGQDSECTFDFTVREVVSMGLFARKNPKNGKQIVQAAMEELGVAPLAERNIQSLSGGERKMVFIARAIAQGAHTLILDEPTNHLDICHQLFVMDYLKQSQKDTLVVIHDLRLAAHYCDYLYMLCDGGVYAQGTPQQVLSRENVSHVFGVNGYASTSDCGGDFVLFSEGTNA